MNLLGLSSNGAIKGKSNTCIGLLAAVIFPSHGLASLKDSTVQLNL